MASINEFARRLRKIDDTYRKDPAGADIAVTRDAAATVLLEDAAQMRHAAALYFGAGQRQELLEYVNDSADAPFAPIPAIVAENPAEHLRLRIAARRMADRAASTRQATQLQAAAVHEAQVAPRLHACGTPRALHVESVSLLARSSAGAVSRMNAPDALAGFPGERGTAIARAREAGAELPTRKQRRRKRGKRGVRARI